MPIVIILNGLVFLKNEPQRFKNGFIIMYK